MKIQRFVLCCAVALAAFGASVGLFEMVRWLGGFSERLNVKVETPVFTLPPQVEFKPAGFVNGPVRVPEPDEPYVNEYGNNGEYYIVGDPPKGFENFNSLSFTERDWNAKEERVVKVKPSGSINTKIEYEFSRVNVTGTRIAAVTKSVKGISYQFDGKFVSEEIKLKSRYGGTYTASVSLKGRLTKWRNGKMIAEAKLNFEMGGC